MMKCYIIFLLVLTSVAAEPITPLPQHIQVNSEKAALGKLLFFETLLSADNTISCATCHHLEEGGDDNLKFSFGVNGTEGDINAPTVYNAVFNFRQFWNGRAKDLEDQVFDPIVSPVEMNNSFESLIPRLRETHYDKKFKKIYSNGITRKNIANAIAEYEKTLITPNAPFDRFLHGDRTAISQEAKEGYILFKSKGCITCHHGINIGGNLYNKFGVMDDVESNRTGRYEVTQKEEDKYYFKVPSLRNVALTAPYLHDGRFETLDAVVKFMAHYQLGRVITQKEVDDLVAFLNTLTGEIPVNAIK